MQQQAVASRTETFAVTPENVSSIGGIPQLARIVFRALAKIRHGSIPCPTGGGFFSGALNRAKTPNS